MAIKKFTTEPYTDIPRWLYERNKTITPDPMKPSEKDTVVEKEIDVSKLSKVLYSSHGPAGKINEIITEINKIPELERRIQALETRMIVAEYDIDILQKRMTTTEQNLVNYVNQLQTADINLQNNLIQAQIDLMTHIIEVQEQLQTQISNNVNSIVSLQYQDVILGAADSRLANTDSQIQDFNRRQQETLNKAKRGR